MASIRIGAIVASIVLAGLHIAYPFATAKPAKDDDSKRVTLKDAEAIMRQHLKINPKVDSGEEVATEPVWKKLKVQVFQIQEGAAFPSRAAVVINDGKPYTIGHDFGGDGVDPLCVADPLAILWLR